MKVKEIKVVIRPPNDDFDETAYAFKKIEKGEDLKDEKIVIERLDALRKILTPERLMIIYVIKTNKPENIHEFNKILGRDENSVTRDLEYLKLIGLIKITMRH